VHTSIENSGDTKSFFRFLVTLVKCHPNQKVIRVLDNVRYHHAKRLKPILRKYQHRLELVYLPPYSPDLNPMERIWWYMRKKITHNRYLENMESRMEKFNQLMEEFSSENQRGRNLTNLIVKFY
jgi:transposase